MHVLNACRLELPATVVEGVGAAVVVGLELAFDEPPQAERKAAIPTIMVTRTANR